MPTADVLAKFIDFGKACLPHLGRDLLGGHAGRLGPALEKAVNQDRHRFNRGGGHVDPQLETAPDGAVQQLGMIGRCDHDHVAGKLVELHEKERDYALDLARFMDVATLFADGVELVEKEHTRHRPCIFEQAGKPGIGLAEIGTHQRVVSDGEQGNGHGFGDRFGQRRLSISGRAREQDAMPRLHSLRAKQIRPALLLDQLA